MQGKTKLCFIILLVSFTQSFAQVAKDFALDVCATTQLHTPDTMRTIVTIKWSSAATTPFSTSYRYKAKNALLWSASVALTASDTCFTDTIATGSEREYQVTVDTSNVLFDYLKYGNILVGRKVPATIQHGRMLVLIDSVYLNAIDTQLALYKMDLIADGFIPVIKYVDRATNVRVIKNYIRAEYAITSTPFFGVILLGNIPVPYSGDYDGSGFGFVPPDGHTTTSAPPSHEGAWSTDLFYGDMSASTLWTDATVTNVLGARAENNNTIGDGKFDQTAMPSAIEVPIGRVDLTDLPAFSQSDTFLLKRYLTKNHNYRAGLTNCRSRLLQDDELGLITGEPFGANSYQIANPIWGDSVSQLDWSTLTTDNYQWAQGYGFGSYTNCVNVASTGNFAANSYNATFTSLFGSYFGDFDISNNLLRSALASEGEILTSVWSGRPKWYFHQMGTGNPIGLSTLMSQNTWNGSYLVYPDALYGAGLVHPSFHGDIGLKLYPYETVPDLVITQDSCDNRFIITWDRHTDSEVFEYVLQRTESLDSSFLDLVVSTTDTFYIDSFPNTGMNYYMVRGIKPIENCSGMHYELSHGLIDSVEYREPVAYAGNDTAVCSGLDVTLGTTFAYDSFIAWSWSPGSMLNDSTLQQPTWTVTQNQDFILSAIDTVSGCRDFDTLSITENPLPLDTIVPPTIFNGCGDSIRIIASHSPLGKTYNWTFGSGTPSTAIGEGSHAVKWNASGYYWINLNVTNNSTGCLKMDSILHYSPNTDVFAGNDTSVCEGNVVSIGSSFAYDTAVSLSWSPGSLLVDSTAGLQFWNASSSQDFILAARDTLSTCVVRDTISITVNPLPIDTISPPILFNTCGDTIRIIASGSPTGKTYDWTFSTGNPSTASGIGSHVVDWTMSGTYPIYLSVLNTTTFCVKQDSIVHNVACVLPVQLISTEASYKTNCKLIHTKWVTTAEYNLQGYYVEWYNGQQLISKTFIPAKSSHLNLINTYSIETPIEQEVNRYRLIELDNNSTTTVLADQAVTSQNCLNNIELFPNPIKLSNHTELTIRNIRGVNLFVLYDASGTQIQKIGLRGQSEIKIKLSQTLKAGIYFVELGNKRFKLVVY